MISRSSLIQTIEKLVMEQGLSVTRISNPAYKDQGSNPQALFILTIEMAQIMEQAKQFGTGLAMMDSQTLTSRSCRGLPTVARPEKKRRQWRTRRQRHSRKYFDTWREMPDSFALNAYDAANIIMDGFQAAFNKASDADRKAVKLDRAVIQIFIADTKGYIGVSGEITFAPNGDVIKNQGIHTVENVKYRQIGVYRIEGGKLVKVN